MFLLRYAKRFFSLGLVLIAIALVASATAVSIAPQVSSIASSYEGTSADLELDVLAERSAMYSADGRFLTFLSEEENREPIALDDVPQAVVTAIIAIEDADFYEHDGVNIRGTVRALVKNANEGVISEGGSTITQQLIKNSLLTNDQNFERKATEAFYAVRLEEQMTKDEILERYLNTLYFGSNAYGVQAAAETYWGYEDASELGWPEAALLAGIIKNPGKYDPTRFPQNAKFRRKVVLNRLVSLGHITEEEAAIYDFAPIPAERQTPFDIQPTDYFIQEALQRLLNDERILGSESRNLIYRGGLKIYTTFDGEAQQAAIAARDNTLPEQTDGFTAAIATVDVRTGAVRALVGGPEFQKNKFNLATQGLRQPGSSMKTFVLAALFEAGNTPRDQVRADGPCTFPVPGQSTKYTVGGSYKGRQRIDAVTRSSNNCGFVRLGQVVGNDKVVDVSRRLGISTIGTNAGEFLSLPLGVVEVHPMEMAAAYASFANDGLYNEPWYIERIEDRDGVVIYEHTMRQSRAVTQQTARLVNEVLESNVTSGTGKNARLSDGHAAAGKTGTTNDSEDAWFVGYTDYYATAVWLGDPDEKRKISLPGYRRGVFGGEIPATIWGVYNEELHSDLDPRDFQPPEPYRGGNYLRVAGELDFCDDFNAEDASNGTVYQDSNGDGRDDCISAVTSTTLEEDPFATTETFVPETFPETLPEPVPDTLPDGETTTTDTTEQP